MRKIPTLFKRDPDNMARVLPIVTPGCEWVLEGQGEATRKYDGTCVMYNSTRLQWFARREVKPGKIKPAGFEAIETDPNTGKTVGWEPIEQSSFFKWYEEARSRFFYGQAPPSGTYELCGPKINGNPEKLEHHELFLHADANGLDAPRSFNELQEWLGDFEGEGIVWHHIDGRMAKLKRRDFPK